jgi:hypothetical protein
VVGLRFQPGALAVWLRVPASELVGARLRLEDFWGAEARRFSDWVSEGRSAAEVALRLETAMALGAKQDDGWPAEIFRLVETHQPGDGQLIDQLTGETGWSERTLRRRCHEAFGYGAKTLERILRFQRFIIRLSAARPKRGWPASPSRPVGHSPVAEIRPAGTVFASRH